MAETWKFKKICFGNIKTSVKKKPSVNSGWLFFLNFSFNYAGKARNAAANAKIA